MLMGAKFSETGRKKDKGDGGVLLMGLMMAKTLAAIGFGGLGLLTMKVRLFRIKPINCFSIDFHAMFTRDGRFRSELITRN
jgi:hypothetical protein